MSPVTLPGDLVSPVAGPLLRRGCPVAVAGIAAGRVYLGESYGMAMLSDGFGPPCAWGTGLVALDLSDSSGMDRAARWLAEHHGLAVGATAPVWRPERDENGSCWCLDGAADWLDLADTAGTVGPRRVTGISAITDPAEALRASCLAACGMAG